MSNQVQISMPVVGAIVFCDPAIVIALWMDKVTVNTKLGGTEPRRPRSRYKRAKTFIHEYNIGLLGAPIPIRTIVRPITSNAVKSAAAAVICAID
jgi:hypothetical protein